MENRPGNTFSMNRRLGSTTYKITVHFSDDDAATMEDKILRLIRNEADTNEPKCGTIATKPLLYHKIPIALPADAGTARHGIMDTPQMSRPA